MSELVQYKTVEGVAVLTLQNPPANAYSYDMMEQLEECIDRTGDSWREGMKRLRVELDKIAKIVDLPGTPSIEEIVDELEILDATLREEG